MIKKATIYTILVLAGATLWSCRKETSLENGKGLAVDMVAVIDGTPWPLLFSLTYSIVLAGPGSVD